MIHSSLFNIYHSIRACRINCNTPFQTVEEPPILPPAFMRGVPEGRGESEYLHCKYSEMPTFHRKVGTPSDPVAPGHLPHKWGRQEVFLHTRFFIGPRRDLNALPYTWENSGKFQKHRGEEYWEKIMTPIRGAGKASGRRLWRSHPFRRKAVAQAHFLTEYPFRSLRALRPEPQDSGADAGNT